MGIDVDTVFSPFVKWAGGKSGLLEQYIPLLPDRVHRYFEPFIGSGAVFFHLRGVEGFAEGYHISDANEELIVAYRVIRDELDALLEKLAEHEANHAKDYYYNIRAMDREQDIHTLPDVLRAARLIYLNKTCYNGLWRVNSKGQFNVPMGRYKNPNILDRERLTAASKALQGVTIANLDFQEAVSEAGEGDFVYFDPPYVPISDTANFTGYYADGFGQAEQQRLAALFADLHERGCRVMLSNSSAPEVRELYDDFDIKTVYARRRINSKGSRRGEVPEFVILNYNPKKS